MRLSESINVGSRSEITIKDLASMISEIVGFKGGILWDKSAYLPWLAAENRSPQTGIDRVYEHYVGQAFRVALNAKLQEQACRSPQQ